ncbi:hypothetical protein ZIOFF_051402 [Zingiber officinale]|uniref:Alkaline/neutral invertase n=1 Tax=Zingiber officinale TaxID=94328 RepID=A0A8J5G2A0_ZINOF|nr:hypothetical protein ZIOFF_051402 [Zingiber officinale]
MIASDDGSRSLLLAVNRRLTALSFHIREYFWVDMKKINEIYRYKTEEYSQGATNKFNIYPEQIPSWLVDWIPEKGGYLIGNLQPAHMDFWFFSLGNLWAITSSLTTPRQAEEILNLMEKKWEDFIWNIPLKICYPALEYEEWHIITGSDPKNANQSRLYQTWTIAGFLASKLLPENPEMASIFTFEEDMELLEGCAYSLTNHPRAKCSRRVPKAQVLV